MTYAFGPFQLDAEARRLTRGEQTVALSDRHVGVLLHLVAHAGQIVSKDALVEAGWGDVAVTDNSLEQAISTLRRSLSAQETGPTAYIETVARRGYRFTGTVTAIRRRASDEALAQMLAPYRGLVDGRAMLETLDRERVAKAFAVFEELTRTAPDYAPGHLGLANALALEMESVRAEYHRNEAALQRALHHASEACRLDPASGEAWATLSVLCHQSRDHTRARAAAERAAALEPENWRHHLRLAYVSWGDARLRAAYRVLKLLPAFPFAHWLAATVHVARQALDKAEHELLSGAEAQDRQPDETPFRSVGLHLLLGLVKLANGDQTGAVAQFHRELGTGATRHIYGREAMANTWCALAAVHLREDRTTEALAALQCALDIVPGHAAAVAATAGIAARAHGIIGGRGLDGRLAELRQQGAIIDAAMAEAVYESMLGEPQRAAGIVLTALEHEPAAGGGWTVAVDPLLHVAAHRHEWQAVLAVVRSRAS